MLLDRIDIDAHGPLHRVELGPLAEGLNTVWGPEGAGKTAIVRFLRDSLISRDYPLGMMSSSTGRVVWADRHGMVHCRREQDGTPSGRRTIEFESRGEYPLRFDALDQSWIRGAAATTEATLALRSIQLAESVVDGVITDTQGTSVARAVAACRHAGLDSSLAEVDESAGARTEDASVRQQLREIEAELARFHPPTADEPSLLARRDGLRARLASGRQSSPAAADGPAASAPDLPEWTDRKAIVAELRRIDDQLAAHARIGWLQRRRATLHQKLGDSAAAPAPAPNQSPLAESASRWLAQLSAGRLQRLDCELAHPAGHDRHSMAQRADARADSSFTVRIDHRAEVSCSQADRTLAVMAVRLAAAEMLNQSGCSVPLVFEISDEHWQQLVQAVPAPAEPAGPPTHRHDAGRRQHPVVTALMEHTAAGNQVVVLTSSRALAGELTRAGSRNFALHPRRVVHPHRPIWQPQYAREHYVGPHPHTYGPHTQPDPASPDQINRDFDAAWREAYGIHSPATATAQSPAERAATSARAAAAGAMTAPPAPSDSQWPDGYYYADHYTTAAPEAAAPAAAPLPRPLTTDGDRPASGASRTTGPHTGAHWIDGRRASGAAASAQSPLSDAPSPAPETPFFLTVDSPIDQAPSIDAVAAARLRGLGITHVTHLMQQDANRLADTLGLANVNAASVRRWRHECRLVCNVPQLRGFDARLLVGCGITDPAQLAAMHPSDLLDRVEAFLTTERGQRILLGGTSYELARITSWMAAAGRAEQREEKDHRDVVRMQRAAERSQRKRPAAESASPPAADPTAEHDERDDFEIRFYLHRNSDVVDAPAIGPRMAQRLAAVGIETVDDLLSAEPDEVADELDHRRVDAETVRQWQQQAELVCRVPKLRGHDAQLLIAAGVHTAEQLAGADCQQLHRQIDPIARSREGRRILRGGRLPDASEVADWIAWAGHHRELKAA